MTKVPPAFWLDPEGDGVPEEPLPTAPEEPGETPDDDIARADDAEDDGDGTPPDAVSDEPGSRASEPPRR